MMRRGLAILVILLTMVNLADFAAIASDENSSQEEENGFDEFFWDYFTYESMLDALNYLEAKHRDIMKVYDLTATIDVNRKGIPSSTWQGRKVWAVKVSDGVETEPDFFSDPNEADILIIGAHHGNEWPSFEVPMYFLFYLVENYGKEAIDNDKDEKINEDPVDCVDNDGDGLIDEDENEGRITYLVNNREIWIVPMLNPDGVALNQRQNGREEVPSGPGGGSVPTTGVDINRNYPYIWWREPDPQSGPSMDSSNPFSSTYRGPDDNYDDDGDSIYPREYLPAGLSKRTVRNVDEDPMDDIDNDNDGNLDEDPDGGFSEPETVALSYLVHNLDWAAKGREKNWDDWNTDIIASISYHTYGAQILYPWGYTVETAPHDGLLRYLGQELSNFNSYEVMQGVELYPTSGDSDDWLYGKYDVLAYTIELDSINHSGKKENIINISMNNLPCNLYLAEMAPVLEVVRERSIGVDSLLSLDIGLPVINHTQKKKTINSDSSYTVEVDISNPEKLEKDSVFLYYRVGRSGDWKKLHMKEMNEEHYKATIPRQNGDKRIYYYIEAKARYEEAESQNGVIYIYSPKYGQSDPYTYFVDISLGDTLGAIAAMVLMMALIFGIIYTGLGKTLKMALDAEKRKSSL